jgi:hypothetical protein
MDLLPNKVKARFTKENIPYLHFGLNKEVELENLIKKRYGTDLKKTRHYATFDWVSKKVKVELKNRKYKYDDWTTTMVGLNKIEDGIKDTRDCYFLFSFTDGSLWEWKLDKSKTYIGETRSEYMGDGTYTTFKPNKLNYYIPMKECVAIIPPKQTGCLIKIKT